MIGDDDEDDDDELWSALLQPQRPLSANRESSEVFSLKPLALHRHFALPMSQRQSRAAGQSSLIIINALFLY